MSSIAPRKAMSVASAPRRCQGLTNRRHSGFGNIIEGSSVALEALGNSIETSGPGCVGASNKLGNALVGASDNLGIASVGASNEFVMHLKSLRTSPTDW